MSCFEINLPAEQPYLCTLNYEYRTILEGVLDEALGSSQHTKRLALEALGTHDHREQSKERVPGGKSEKNS